MMRTFWRAILVLMVAAVILGGCGSKQSTGVPTDSKPGDSNWLAPQPAPQPAPPAPQPAPSTPPTATQPFTQLPGDQAALTAALSQVGKVQYQILVAEDTKGLDQDRYLDQLLAERKWPEADMLLLVIYPKQNHDIRFAMGSVFFGQRVTVSEMLGLLRTAYLPKGRIGNPAGGLADLIQSVNQRMAQ